MKGYLSIITGRVGEGKTSLALSRVELFPRSLYIDPKCEVKHGVIIEDRGSLAAYIAEHEERYRITYYPQSDDLGEEVFTITQALIDLADLRIRRGMEAGFEVHYDEFELYAESGKRAAPLLRLMRLREKYPAFVQIICHRPSDIPTDYRVTVNDWSTFLQTSRTDLDRLERETGASNIELVSRLKTHEYASWRGRDFSGPHKLEK